MDGQTDRGRIDRQTGGLLDKWKGRRADDGQTDGLTDGQTVRQTDRQGDRK
jgi:hypothetical protein